jgi:hypothetical protein
LCPKYYIDANGFEVILQFAIENAWVVIFHIYEEKTSRVYIETLEDCEFMFSPETKELFVRAQNLNALSDPHATQSCGYSSVYLILFLKLPPRNT